MELGNDDYPVIEYKILSYLYACLKSGKDPDARKIDTVAFGLNGRYWERIILLLAESRKVVGVYKDDDDKVVFDKLSITTKGIERLFDSDIMKMAAEFVKSSRSRVPRP